LADSLLVVFSIAAHKHTRPHRK